MADVVIQTADGATVARGNLRVLTARMERYRPQTLHVQVYADGGALLSVAWSDGTHCGHAWEDARACLEWARGLAWPVAVSFPRGAQVCGR